VDYLIRPVIAIVGRPNVGKSTLFNRIIGQRKAIVEDRPGITRDRNYATAEHAGVSFSLVDTGGFDPEAEQGMLALMKSQVSVAVEEADAIVVVVDGRGGVTPLDETVWHVVRQSHRNSYLAVNKIDNPGHSALLGDFYRLGVNELFAISAENGAGVAELVERVLGDLDAAQTDTVSEDDGSGPTRIAIIGRPNVGKSTFANALLGTERYLTSDLPGTTRDSVDTAFVANDHEYILVDTAGVRKRRRVEKGVERMSVSRTIRAMERSHVVALLFDIAEGITDQDKKLASLAIERGRGLILLANKWDLLSAGPKAGDEQKGLIKEKFVFAGFVPHLFISALKDKNVDRFLPVVDRVQGNLMRRIPTRELNLFYKDVIRTHPPSTSGTRTVRIKYLTQVAVNPPTILLFKGGKAPLQKNYISFLKRKLRERYGFEGVPIRLISR